ncbi:MAG: cytochrome c [Bacteroidales bacterium]|nr:cytochrome c [Bacteroidales bacterium]
MDKINILKYLLIVFGFLIFSCNNSEIAETVQIEVKGIDTDETKSIENTDFSLGEQIYRDNCMICHQENGMGVDETYPPLAASDYMLADKIRSIKLSVYGSKDSIIVNGIKYSGGSMTFSDLENEQIVSVVNYIRNSWGNEGGIVTIEDVNKAIEKK